MKVIKVSKTILVTGLAVVFFPVMLIGAVYAAMKIAYKFGYAIAFDMIKGI